MVGWLSLLGTVLGQVANVAMTRKNNADNRKLAEYQNAQAQQQSNIAYERSKPTNQVANLMQAGMSKAGALNVLSGGGSYQPAPISSSTSNAPQVDLTHAFDGLLQSAENAKQRKMQDDLLNKQIAASKEAQQAQIASDEKKHAAQLDSNERIAAANRTSNETIASERLEFDREQFEFNKPKVLAEIDNIKKNGKVLDSVAKGNNLDNIRKEFENKQLPELAKIAQTESWLRIQHIAQTMAHENAEHITKQERENLELEFYRATMDSNINLINLQNELKSYLSASELNMYNTPFLGDFIGALSYVMNNLAPKLALFK